MMSFIEKWDWSKVDWELVAIASGDTLLMSFFALVGAVAIGLPLGVFLFLTSKDNLLESRLAYGVLGMVVNFFRSVPFVILLIWLIPFTRLVMGTTFGIKGALPALIMGAAPFFARLVEQVLRSLNPGIREACRAMGANVFQTVFGALLPEARTGIIGATVVTAVALIGYSAMCGVIGAGGLGDVAINYGYYRYETELMWITVLLIVLIVQIVEFLGQRIVLKFTRK